MVGIDNISERFNTFTAKSSAAYQAWAKAMTYSSANSYTTLQELMDFFQANWTDTSAKDKATLVDPTALTNDQATELTNWFAAVINNITAELGIQDQVGLMTPTVGMIDDAVEVAKLAVENNIGQTGGHYLYGLNKAAYEHGLTDGTTYLSDEYKTTVAPSNTFGESALHAPTTTKYNQFTMADAKELLFEAIVYMLGDDLDSEMGHTTALLGINSLLWLGEPKGSVLGVSISGDPALADSE